MQKYLKLLKVFNYLMIPVAAVACIMVVVYGASQTLPFGMTLDERVSPMFCMVMLTIMAVAYVLQTIFGFQTLRKYPLGKVCNLLGWFAWGAQLFLLIYLMDGSTPDIVIMLIMFVPAILETWVAQAIAYSAPPPEPEE